MQVLEDEGELGVAIMTGHRRVKLGIRQAAGKEKEALSFNPNPEQILMCCLSKYDHELLLKLLLNIM